MARSPAGTEAGGRGLGSVRGDGLGPLLSGTLELLRVLAAGLLGRLSGLLSDVLAALDGLLAGLLDLILHLVGHRADLLVLDPRARDEQPGDEADGDAADRQAERVLLRDASGPLDLPAVGRDVGDLAGQPVLGLADAVLGAALDVRLVADRVHGVAHLGAGLLYARADGFWLLAHSTSSFTVSTVCSGTGGVAARMRLRPARPSPAATAAITTVTISAASQASIAVLSSRIRKAVSAPAARRPTTAAPPISPAPWPAMLAFCDISALARSSSWRTSVDVCPASCLTRSPIGRSRSSSGSVWCAVMAAAAARSRASGCAAARR